MQMQYIIESGILQIYKYFIVVEAMECLIYMSIVSYSDGLHIIIFKISNVGARFSWIQVKKYYWF